LISRFREVSSLFVRILNLILTSATFPDISG
jgi:hypothetical protein